MIENAETAGFLRNEWALVNSRLESLCQWWESVLQEESHQIPNEETGSVLTVIRQTQLLIDQKCKMYFDLIRQFETGEGEKPVFLTDLESFKELVQQQVTNNHFPFNLVGLY